MFVLQGSSEAVDIALKLNATVDPFSGATAKWAAVDLLKERGEETLTPAERVSSSAIFFLFRARMVRYTVGA